MNQPGLLPIIDISKVLISDFEWFGWNKKNGKILICNALYYVSVGQVHLEARGRARFYNRDSSLLVYSTYKQNPRGAYEIDGTDRKYGVFEDGRLFNRFLFLAKEKGVLQITGQLKVGQRTVLIQI